MALILEHPIVDKWAYFPTLARVDYRRGRQENLVWSFARALYQDLIYYPTSEPT